MRFLTLLIFCFSFIFSPSYSQTRIDSSSTAQPDQYVKKKRNIFKGEPGRAALFSLIIPGGGQVYNKDYWKVPLVLAAEGAAVYYVVDNNRIFTKWNTCYESIVNNMTDEVSCGTVTSADTAFRIRQTFRSRRELSYVFVGIAHLLNIVEAYVDRHLTLFDISDDLSLMTVPSHSNIEPQVTFVKLRIPLN